MLARRLSKIDGRRLRVESLVEDPNGQWLGLWADGHLFLLQTLMVLKTSEMSRNIGKEEHSYSWGEDILPLVVITPSSAPQQISSIVLSQKGPKGRYLLFIAPKTVEVVTVDSKNGQPLTTTIHRLPFERIHANLVGFHLYLPLCNLTLAVIDLALGILSLRHASTMPKKDNAIFASPVSRGALMGRELTCLLDGEEKVWQTAGGVLMRGRIVVSDEFGEELLMSNSMDEFEYCQKMLRHPIKYYLSVCREYLIGSHRISLQKHKEDSIYRIRCRGLSWAQVCQLEHWPEINPFWTHYAQYQQQIQKNSQLSQRLMIAQYLWREQMLTISWIVIDYGSRKKSVKHREETFHSMGKEQQIKKKEERYEEWQEVRYRSQKKVLCEFRQLKHPVKEMKWMGLCELMLLLTEGQLLFLQFDATLLDLSC